MNIGKIRRLFSKHILKGIALISAVMLFGASGCTLNFNNGNSDPSGKDNDAITHAQIVSQPDDTTSDNNVSPDNTSDNTGNPDTNSNVTDNGNDNDKTQVYAPSYTESCGFEVTNPGSFADRAQGVYRIVSDGRVEEFIEFYNVNDSLYAFYSGNGYGAMELFTDDYVGFASTTSNTMPVSIWSFSSQTDEDGYISGGNPARMVMTLTKDGIEFTDYEEDSGDTLFAPSECKLERIDGEMGHLDGFAYMDDEFSAELLCQDMDIKTAKIPDEIAGSWILLGDAENGIVFEFTKDGFVQAYLKNPGEIVTFLRGTYTVGRDKVNKGTNIYMNMVYFGLGEGYPFNLCYTLEDKNLVLVHGNEEYGQDVAWEGAMFIPFKMNSIARLYPDDNMSVTRDFDGTYTAGDNTVLLLSPGDYFYYYEFDKNGEYKNLVEGYFEITPGCLKLYETDYKDGNDIYFGYIALWDQDTLDLTIDETQETIRFTRQ